MTNTITGERLILRPPTLEDVDTRTAWFADPTVTRHLPLAGRGSLPRESVEGYLRSVMGRSPGIVDYTIQDRAGRAIGSCSLRGFDDAGRAELSLLLGETDTWGKGFGREATELLLQHAFRDLGLNCVWLVVREDNARAISLYGRLGFRRDGVYRAAEQEDGRYLNKEIMSLLRSEWAGGGQ